MPPIKLKLSLGGVKPKVLDTDSNGTPSGPSTPKQSAKASRRPTPKLKSEEANDSPSLRVVLPLNGAPSPSTPAQSAGPSTAATPSATPVSTPGADPAAPPKRKRGRPKKAAALTAIPSHVVTPKSVASPPAPLATPSDFNVKLEPNDDDDPLAYTISENGTPVDSTSTPATPWRDGSEDYTAYTRPAVKWKRVKKPFRELANKILTEMRRKDEYGFFLDPVNLDDNPTYLDIIGGKDKMMDLGTMQNKIDTNEYSTIDQIESDLRLMIDAALTFNLPGTAPYREANKVFKQGMKHIERSRPLVLTPTPSPSPSVRASVAPESGRGTPAPRPKAREREAALQIPEIMLEFPPNSLQAKAVGWNLTGGRRVRAKRLVRGRERFTGKWRDYLPDGSHDVAEMDDPADMLEHLRTRQASTWKDVPDWPRIYAEDEDWWAWDGLGGPTGQPPLPGAARLKPKTLRTRTLNAMDFGRFDEVERQMREAQQPVQPEGEPLPSPTEFDDVELLAEHLRPDAPPAPKLPPGLPPQNFVDVYARKPAVNYLYDMCLGGVRGEAYAASVARFVQGAVDGAKQDDDEDVAGEGFDLQEYVAKKWHDGVVFSGPAEASRRAYERLSDATRAPKPEGDDAHEVLQEARNAYARIALRDLNAPTNPLDIQPFLRQPADFMHVGVGGKNGVEEALQWTSNEIQRLAREREAKAQVNGTAAHGSAVNGDVEMVDTTVAVPTKRPLEDPEEPDAKRPKVDAPKDAETKVATPNGTPASPSANGTQAASNTNKIAPAPATAPTPTVDNENGLRSLRLELVALSKFYPLASLKKMDAADAIRLLPANVRNLMTRPSQASTNPKETK